MEERAIELMTCSWTMLAAVAAAVSTAACMHCHAISQHAETRTRTGSWSCSRSNAALIAVQLAQRMQEILCWLPGKLHKCNMAARTCVAAAPFAACAGQTRFAFCISHPLCTLHLSR